MVIVIDTREQRPWSFPPDVEVKRGTLKQGDYALEGDAGFAIERKSLEDFVGTVSTGWARFCRELNRMDAAGMEVKVVIVEGNWEQCCFRCEAGEILPPDHEHVRLSPAFLRKRVAELTVSRKTAVLFAGDAGLAAAMALALFREREKNGNHKEN